MGLFFRTPEGFLDLIGRRVGGRYPTQISDAAVPVIDITTLLSGRTVSSEGGISLTSALGDQITLTVPQGEVWVVFNYAVEWQTSAVGQDAEFKVFLTKLPGSTAPVNRLILPKIDWYTNRSPLGAAALVGNGCTIDPVACSPGVEITAEVADCSENNLAWSLHVGLYKLIGN